MVKYIGKRILISLLIVFMVSVFAFSVMHLLKGDPARLALGEYASEEDVQKLRTRMNLDKPLVEQYVLWITGIFSGDLGYSVVYNRQVEDILAERLPRTFAIGIPAMILSFVAGVGFGVICAVQRGKIVDNALTVLSTLGLGTPAFWLGIFGIYFFSIELKLLPLQGFVSPGSDFGDYLLHAVLPVICLSVGMVASITRQTRSNMLEVINQDYIRTARANGLKSTSILIKHALKNALIPVVTIMALQVRTVIGGSLIIENIFNIAGVGSLLNTAVSGRDYLVVQACVLIVSFVTVGCNLIVDILYGVIDPRVRLGER